MLRSHGVEAMQEGAEREEEEEEEGRGGAPDFEGYEGRAVKSLDVDALTALVDKPREGQWVVLDVSFPWCHRCEESARDSLHSSCSLFSCFFRSNIARTPPPGVQKLLAFHAFAKNFVCTCVLHLMCRNPRLRCDALRERFAAAARKLAPKRRRRRRGRKKKKVSVLSPSPLPFSSPSSIFIPVFHSYTFRRRRRSRRSAGASNSGTWTRAR